VQNKSFEETVNSAATQQVENKSEYYKKRKRWVHKQRRFIMYFDTDLTIKEANIPQSSLIRRFRNVIVRKSG
jgi:hypothetical protein